MTTLTEYKYLGNDAEVRMGIAKAISKVSPWLRDLPFNELANNNISRYKMYKSYGGASAHEVGDDWVTINPEWEYRDAPLMILGDNIAIDKFGDFASGKEDAVAAMIEGKSEGVGETFDKLAVYGRTTATGVLSSSKNLKGLLRMIAETESDTTTDLDGWLYTGNDGAANNKQAVFGASGASVALSLAMLDALISAVRPKASHLVMSRLMLRKLNGLAQAAGNNLEHDKSVLGYPVTRFGEQIVLIDDQIQDNMTDSSALVTDIASYDYTKTIVSGYDTSPIFAVNMSESGLCGINGEGMIQVEPLGTLEGKDATGYRVKFYCGMRLTNARAAAVLLNTNYSG